VTTSPLAVGALAVALSAASQHSETTIGAPKPPRVLAVVSSSGGPAPALDQLSFLDDGSVLAGPLGTPEPCPRKLTKEQLNDLRQGLTRSTDALYSAAVVDYTANISDAITVTFLLGQPLPLSDVNEVEIPVELFPASLLAFAEQLDALASSACGAIAPPILDSIRLGAPDWPPNPSLQRTSPGLSPGFGR